MTSIVLNFVLKSFYTNNENYIKQIKANHDRGELLQKELKLQYNNISALINSTNDFIWSIDLNFNLLIANTTYIDRIKRRFNADFKTGSTVMYPFMDQTVLDKWKKLYERCFAGEVFIYEENIYNDGKLEEVIEVKFHPIYNENGEVIGASCLGTTITARKIDQLLIEGQNQKLREIAWSQSHEIRGPLSRIMGLIYLIEDNENLTEEQREVINYIKESASELDLMIHKVVNLTERLDTNNL